MRIISGRFKGKRFQAPKNLPTRPTTDFAKEALFNILRNRLSIDSIEVLDLFAGIGSISLEFLSRESIRCQSIERNINCIKFMNVLKRELQLSNWEILRRDVFKHLKNNTSQFDIVFADPPYASEEFHQLLDLVFEKNVLKKDGLFILEHGKESNFSDHQHFQEVKNYGNVNFTFFA